ncbi:MAG: hypothetical protein J6Y47_09350 [Bacteroidales bacterium]|nr:hypothetical protein [Bacteroidales bacterium]
MQGLACVCVKYTKTFFLLIAIYLAFAFIACILPSAPVHEHIVESLDKGKLVEDYPHVVFSGPECQMDNFTDALILSQVWNSNPKQVWHSMMLPSYSKEEGAMCDNLRVLAMSQYKGPNYAYPRYWHGSTFLMRVLLFFTNYTLLRFIFFATSMLLLIWTTFRIWRVSGWMSCMLFFMPFLLLYGFVMQLSIQFFPVLVLSLIGCIMACNPEKNYSDFAFVLFMIGSFTAFFDLLTTPLLTFGLPLCIYLFVHKNRVEHQAWARSIFQISICGISWMAAYGLTWSSKWFIASMASSINVFRDATQQVTHRMGDLEDFNRWDAVMANINLPSWEGIVIVLIILLLLSVFRFNKKGIKPMLLFLLISLLPYAWYFCIANHSYLHYWFTYRLQMVSVMAWFMALASIVNWDFFDRLNHNFLRRH